MINYSFLWRLKNMPITIKHLKEQDVGYFEHWWRAIKISGALLVHAFLPDVLSDYASKEICDD
jgi:hypothetical protein